MNLKRIKTIIDSSRADSTKEFLIIEELSKDLNVTTTIIKLLDAERKRNEDLTTELNFQLSRAHVGLEDPKLNENGFMQKEIQEFYETGVIGHCFKNLKEK